MQPVKPGTVTTTPKIADSKNDESPIESNIVHVNKFFSSNPWLSFDSDGTSKVDGVRFAVYLEGPTSPHGVFGTGRMVVTMYQLDCDPTGKESAKQLYEWDLPPEKAYPWRAKTRTALGWGYGLRLQWDRNIDIAGKQIAFLVKYIREDGKTITSSRQVLKGPGGPEPFLMTKSARETSKAANTPRAQKSRQAAAATAPGNP
jgi:hypothetical protein